ncbi:uncharacterized protein MONOS_2593 [Monocercomonoides exilis]|uniref:uncharacterized protein n=1 Tax=Monocercomonoides exilis TaxID=2049356 RepID=UPI00355A585C|nr:hypothetical protein MONOS_2593 [Monocercomonoides exilis]|eukprot:MONOS_2593.1-p1 / transcript=MONOS_2593.1 / gene=MONOS_2593 / organism=Monocercomonoides_exilis_PA203 / gene_product=unspecified product / transcript_product=unspecified product / location=Mono_scaffold00054:118441-120454(-) / protein_length=647 / sequence_SO=supercontig / SO=protein_coding / is_pseudo=false
MVITNNIVSKPIGGCVGIEKAESCVKAHGCVYCTSLIGKDTNSTHGCVEGNLFGEKNSKGKTKCPLSEIFYKQTSLSSNYLILIGSVVIGLISSSIVVCICAAGVCSSWKRQNKRLETFRKQLLNSGILEPFYFTIEETPDGKKGIYGTFGKDFTPAIKAPFVTPGVFGSSPFQEEFSFTSSADMNHGNLKNGVMCNEQDELQFYKSRESSRGSDEVGEREDVSLMNGKDYKSGCGRAKEKEKYKYYDSDYINWAHRRVLSVREAEKMLGINHDALASVNEEGLMHMTNEKMNPNEKREFAEKEDYTNFLGKKEYFKEEDIKRLKYKAEPYIKDQTIAVVDEEENKVKRKRKRKKEENKNEYQNDEKEQRDIGKEQSNLKEESAGELKNTDTFADERENEGPFDAIQAIRDEADKQKKEKERNKRNRSSASRHHSHSHLHHHRHRHSKEATKAESKSSFKVLPILSTGPRVDRICPSAELSLQPYQKNAGGRQLKPALTEEKEHLDIPKPQQCAQTFIGESNYSMPQQSDEKLLQIPSIASESDFNSTNTQIKTCNNYCSTEQNEMLAPLDYANQEQRNDHRYESHAQNGEDEQNDEEVLLLMEKEKPEMEFEIEEGEIDRNEQCSSSPVLEGPELTYQAMRMPFI